MNDYIKANIRKIIYKSDTGYVVGIAKVKDASPNYKEYVSHSISFTGIFSEVLEGENYILYGSVINHPKYGEQFSVELYDREIPEEKDSLVEFLSSGTFKGIGEKTAEKIVDVLGKEAINIIIENPSNLSLIPGISKKQIENLHNTLLEYKSSYNIILGLNELGFTTKESKLIYNKYKNNTNNIIEENLYKIASDIKEINFKKIDSIALKQNYERCDRRRIKAAIIYVMIELCNTLGHCYLDINTIYKYTKDVILENIAEEEFIKAINELILDIKVVKENDKYYLASMWECENNIAKRITHLVNKKDTKCDDIDSYLDEIEKDFQVTYNNEQKEAIKNSYLKNFFVITGGPGTGKTTIISAVIELYKRVNKLSANLLLKDLALLAPTGRASKRLAIKTNFKASTIHSFLKWNKEQDKFAINEYNKSDVKFVIIDEASMIDVPLFNSLLKGIKVDTKIIMVGDYNQLPSVGPGELLKDIIDSNCTCVTSLKTLYRQSEDSNIITLAHDMNEGCIDEDIFSLSSDIEFISTNNVLEVVGEKSKNYIKNDFHDFQVLAPMYKGISGIDAMNKKLQEIFNAKSPKKKEITITDTLYREGDKVLCLVNMPDEHVYNGDIGIIEEINKGEIIIDFDDSEVRFTPNNYSKFKLAYAISIHKSQGSEFDTIILPVVKNYGKMLYRKLYYTAVTRSKKKLIIIGDIDALKSASNNNMQDIRKTNIKEKLISMKNK